MSYKVTISSYGGNTTVMAKSFVMIVRSVAQTWYSSLRTGTITSRDGNGYPKPETRWVKTLLGHGYDGF
jgi:hypothetical protein